MKIVSSLLAVFLCPFLITAQLVINEGSHRNFSVLLDEDLQAKDWIELYNSGNEAIDLNGYSLSDDPNQPDMWTFPSFVLDPGEFLLVFCSEKDRYFSNPFQDVFFEEGFVPEQGWSEHPFSEPFYWNGTSDLIINTCSYSDQGYTVNSIFSLTETPFVSTIVNYQDGTDAPCYATGGEVHSTRPLIRLNEMVIGNATTTNGDTWYPAPYGNWYWGARNQMLIRSEELIDAGLTEGWIDELAFEVVYTEPTFYTYFSLSIRAVEMDELDGQFVGNEGAFFHTNFALSSEGDQVYLWDPENEQIQSLSINSPGIDTSTGLFPDAGQAISYFSQPTPGETNSGSLPATGIAAAPVLTLESGVYSGVQNVHILDPNTDPATIHYTTNGELPTQESPVYEGEPIPIFQSSVVRARAFAEGLLPSQISAESYLINVSHSTPVISVIADPNDLTGPEGIFTNWPLDLEKFAHMAYFDSTSGHPLLFERRAAIQIDGGAGGSRSHPQHSFRLEFAKGSLAESPVEQDILPQRPEREEYSKLYFRNGSNMWLTLPYKDGAQLEMLCRASNGYYSAMRPATVYINGQYFGLYEMREKLDEEYFEQFHGLEEGSAMDILTVSYWYGGFLRANSGNAQNYLNDLNTLFELDQSEDSFVESVAQYFDLDWYTDYIIGESWVGNTDWPYNNIKLHRSEGSDDKWRFATIDVELSLQPGGWTDCYFNGLQHTLNQGEGNPFTGIWYRCMQHDNYRNGFINRYADLLNTAYHPDRLLAIEQDFFNRFVVEMPKEYQRWADPWNVTGWMNGFYENHITFQNELICKSDIVRDQIENTLDLDGQCLIELNVFPEGAGTIRINSIQPDQYPWDGIYFNGIPVSIEAVASEGYAFAFWEDNDYITEFTEEQWIGDISGGSVEFNAHFYDVVNIEENNERDLILFPNPASEHINLQGAIPALSAICIRDLCGRSVLTKIATNGNTQIIEVNERSPGIYILEITNDHSTIASFKWLKL